MNHNNPLYDSDDWPLRNPQREGSISTATQDSGSSIISLTQYAPPLSPPLSSPSSIRKYSLYSVPEETERIELAAAVTVYVARFRSSSPCVELGSDSWLVCCADRS